MQRMSISLSLRNFYPRSPCGERPVDAKKYPNAKQFLSTLSLRRATAEHIKRLVFPLFLSTLSLRRATDHYRRLGVASIISIHALLAESDRAAIAADSAFKISIHALLAESDGRCYSAAASHRYFYPRSPCGERRRNRCRPVG